MLDSISAKLRLQLFDELLFNSCNIVCLQAAITESLFNKIGKEVQGRINRCCPLPIIYAVFK